MQPIYCFSLFSLFLFSIISFGIQIRVARKLKQKGVDTGWAYTTGGAVLTLVRGYQHADELGIRELMVLWSLVLGIAVLSGIVIIINIISTPR